MEMTRQLAEVKIPRSEVILEQAFFSLTIVFVVKYHVPISLAGLT